VTPTCQAGPPMNQWHLIPFRCPQIHASHFCSRCVHWRPQGGTSRGACDDHLNHKQPSYSFCWSRCDGRLMYPSQSGLSTLSASSAIASSDGRVNLSQAAVVLILLLCFSACWRDFIRFFCLEGLCFTCRFQGDRINSRLRRINHQQILLRPP
jgi:hypothetical protein